ncbi:MAG: DUF3014 domain-containing protein [Gammaproteobacteria bacterium]|nr:DUF3014 domain-containing protein [Gammaproteobacteria bacterium]
MKERGLGLIAVAAIVIIAAFLFFPRKTAKVESLPEPPPALEQPVPVPSQEPAIKFPVPEAPPPEKPLPVLQQSDQPVREDIAALIGADAVAKFLAPEELIRRIVSTVDNLPREKLALRLWPVRPTAGKFAVLEQGGKTLIAPENPSRYQPFVAVMSAVDTRRAAGLYQHYYPLFQQAYRDLGYPSGYFNDRLVAVIDHLLATPEAPGAVELVRPAVYYKYADPKLEKLSAGQKILLRVGPDNAKLLRSKLAEFRGHIAGADQRGE